MIVFRIEKKTFPQKNAVENLGGQKTFLFDDRHIFLWVLVKYSFVSSNDKKESIKMRSEFRTTIFLQDGRGRFYFNCCLWKEFS